MYQHYCQDKVGLNPVFEDASSDKDSWKDKSHEAAKSRRSQSPATGDQERLGEREVIQINSPEGRMMSSGSQGLGVLR